MIVVCRRKGKALQWFHWIGHESLHGTVRGWAACCRDVRRGRCQGSEARQHAARTRAVKPARAGAKRRTALAVAGGGRRAILPGGDPVGAARVRDTSARAVACSGESERPRVAWTRGAVSQIAGSVRRENPRPGHLDPAADKARLGRRRRLWRGVQREGGDVADEVKNRFRRALVSDDPAVVERHEELSLRRLEQIGDLVDLLGRGRERYVRSDRAARSGSSSEALSTTWMSVFAQMD